MGNHHKKDSKAQKKPSLRGKLTRMRLLLLCISLAVLALIIGLLSLRPWAKKLALPELTSSNIVVMDATSGKVIYDKNGTEARPPASLTKLMTTYLVFEDISQGRLALTDRYCITPAEANTPGSKYGLHPGMTLTVEQLLAGTILNSGCDCVQSLVQLTSGSEDAFVTRMNDMAATLGLSGTQFSNATGLDDAAHYMTARDLATLSYRLLLDHPEYLDYSSQATMELGGLSFQNLNVLVGHDPRVQGLKTGTTVIGGNNLVTYGVWEGKSYLIVLLNSASEQRRFTETQTILNLLFGALDHGQS